MKQLFYPATLFVVGFSGAALAGTEPATEADDLWGKLKQIAEKYVGAQKGAAGGPNLNETFTRAEIYRARSLVLEFYEKYPADPRTVELRRTLLTNSSDGHPLGSIPFAVSRVEREYGHRSRADVDREVRVLTDAMSDPEFKKRSLDQQEHVLNYQALVVSSVLRQVHQQERINLDEERAIYRGFREGPQRLRELAIGRENVLALYEKPLDLKLPLREGGVLDLRQKRGKAILLDFWSSGCSSCIAALPRVQYIYDKYRDRGFEVIGVYLVDEDDPKKRETERKFALRTMKEQGTTWSEMMVVGKDAVATLWKQYAFPGVPTIWLLDKDGRLVRDVDSSVDFYGPRAGQSRIETEIERLIGAPAGIASR